MFGIGFAVQLDSAERRGAHFTRHFSRRLTILFIIGMAHALIWYGDILKDYALIGFVLLATARWTATGIGRAAAAVLFARALWPLLVIALVIPLAAPEQGSDPAGDFFERARIFAGTDPWAIFNTNLELLRIKALQMIYDGKAVSVLGMFLVGARIGKRRLYRNLVDNKLVLRRIFVMSAVVGVIGNAALVPIDWATPEYPPTTMWVVEQALFAIAVPAMRFAYASGFALLWQSRVGVALRLLAPVGRMALTTYVSQTLIGVSVFYGIGLAQGGTIGLVECMFFAVMVFALQCVVSGLWLRFFRFGPLERIWRRTTYGTPLPMLRRIPVAA